jgi:biotin carboxyl carrier protein
MGFKADIDGRGLEFEIVRRRPHLRLRLAGAEHDVEELAADSGQFAIAVDGRVYRGWRYRSGRRLHLRFDGRSFLVELAEGAGEEGASARQTGEIRAEMPGMVIDIQCTAGALVAEGRTLLTIESMKLQTAIIAPFDCLIERIHVEPNATFERNAALVSIKPSTPPPEAS